LEEIKQELRQVSFIGMSLISGTGTGYSTIRLYAPRTSTGTDNFRIFFILFFVVCFEGHDEFTVADFCLAQSSRESECCSQADLSSDVGL
jgi:hypothetical protein